VTLSFIRSFFLILNIALGYYIGVFFDQPLGGAMIGFFSGVVLIFLESRMRSVSVRGLSSMVFGLLLGVFMAKLISDIMIFLPMGSFWHSVVRVALTLIFSYLGAVMALRGKDEFHLIIPYVRFRRQDSRDRMIILDTSALIDGRVADICKINFMPGRLIVSRSVLRELQALADSTDDTKRQRGRRGMDLLKRMQSDPQLDVAIHEDEANPSESVDSRLIVLAKMMDGALCTNDFNLSEIASLQGVEVLNIQGLARAVASVIFSGDEISVRLLKEGRDAGQAVAYMDDGTMVVVNNSLDRVGQEVRVRVISVLQTTAGKMIFADLVE
jgi:uncharacterized protein YacL